MKFELVIPNNWIRSWPFEALDVQINPILEDEAVTIIKTSNVTLWPKYEVLENIIWRTVIAKFEHDVDAIEFKLKYL